MVVVVVVVVVVVGRHHASARGRGQVRITLEDAKKGEVVSVGMSKEANSEKNRQT